MKSFWIYRLLFAACIALSIGAVTFTLSTRQRSAVRAETTRARSVAAARALEVPQLTSSTQRTDPAPVLFSRVRITTVVPFRREIHLFNFGDAAEDLSGWRLVSPRSGGDDSYSFPAGTILLPNEALIVVVDEGVDEPSQLHWRTPPDVSVLDAAADTVALQNEDGVEVSRFQYTRR